MQRTAQDWIVLTELTRHNATAIGIVTGLQFGPQVLLLPWTGLAADRFDRRKLLIATQTAMGVLALGLGLLTVTGVVRLWQVYVFAFLLGCAAAFDAPARQTFVTELVARDDVSNAVALNSTSFNAARLLGPAAAGVLIGAVGSGWVFLINAVSYAAVLAALGLLRVQELHRENCAVRAPGSLGEGFRYVLGRPDLLAVLLMIFSVGTLGHNFPIYLSTMSVSEFHAGAKQYGLLTSMMAVGSVAGALLSARRKKPGFGSLLVGASVFALGFALAAAMPTYWLFGLSLVLIGAASQTFNTTVLSTMQLAAEPAMRGRVMALTLAVALGGIPLGGPLVGRVADVFGPRWALLLGAFSGFMAVAIGLGYLRKYRNLRVRIEAGRVRWTVERGAVPVV